MNKITSTLLTIALAAWGADAPETPKPKPIEDAIWEKALADNTKPADAAIVERILLSDCYETQLTVFAAPNQRLLTPNEA